MNISENIVYTSSPETVERAYRFLESHPAGVISTVQPDGMPHAVVVYFTINKEFEMFFVTKVETRKYRNIRSNPNAVIVSFDNFSQTTVQVTGVVSEEKDDKLRRALLSTLDRLTEAGTYSRTPPITKLEAGEYIVLKLKPEMIRMAIFMRPESGGYDIFETIEFKYPRTKLRSLATSQV